MSRLGGYRWQLSTLKCYEIRRNVRLVGGGHEVLTIDGGTGFVAG
jgi:hypothetical protein